METGIVIGLDIWQGTAYFLTPMTKNIPTLDQLERGLQIAQRIAQLQAEMTAIFGGSASASSAIVARPGRAKSRKRKLSPQAIANIRAAQKKRWAKFKGKKTSGARKVSAKPAKRGGLTPAGRARLAAAMKKRWAAARRSGGPLPTAKK